MEAKQLIQKLAVGNFIVTAAAGMAVTAFASEQAVILYALFSMAQLSAMFVTMNMLERKDNFEPEILEWQECQVCGSDVLVSYYDECSACGEIV